MFNFVLNLLKDLGVNLKFQDTKFIFNKRLMQLIMALDTKNNDISIPSSGALKGILRKKITIPTSSDVRPTDKNVLTKHFYEEESKTVSFNQNPVSRIKIYNPKDAPNQETINVVKKYLAILKEISKNISDLNTIDNDKSSEEKLRLLNQYFNDAELILNEIKKLNISEEQLNTKLTNQFRQLSESFESALKQVEEQVKEPRKKSEIINVNRKKLDTINQDTNLNKYQRYFTTLLQRCFDPALNGTKKSASQQKFEEDIQKINNLIANQIIEAKKSFVEIKNNSNNNKNPKSIEQVNQSLDDMISLRKFIEEISHVYYENKLKQIKENKKYLIFPRTTAKPTIKYSAKDRVLPRLPIQHTTQQKSDSTKKPHTSAIYSGLKELVKNVSKRTERYKIS